MEYNVFTQGYLSTNCVVLSKNEQLIVVDIPYNAYGVYNFVRSSGKKVLAVLLTHGHFDHCGGVKQFFEKCGLSVPVYINKRDDELARHAGENCWGVPAENCFPTDFVSEGTLNIGDFSFTVLETPGHTAGSVVYITEDIILCGDTLMKGCAGRTDFPESVPAEMPQSLEKLKSLNGDKKVIGGHGELTNLEYEKRTNPFLR